MGIIGAIFEDDDTGEIFAISPLGVDVPKVYIRELLENSPEFSKEEFLYKIDEAVNYEIGFPRKPSLHERTRQSFNSTRKKLRQQMTDSGLEKVCVHCGTTDNITIDHIKPIFAGGSNELENLQFLCQSCNSKKGIKIGDILEIQ